MSRQREQRSMNHTEPSSAQTSAAEPVRVIADYHDLAGELRTLREDGVTIALANGCFDVLHVGHLRLLAEAATTADLLDLVAQIRNLGLHRCSVAAEVF